MSQSRNQMSIADVDREMLRAWAEAGIISHAIYIAEIERRNSQTHRETVHAIAGCSEDGEDRRIVGVG